MLQFANRIKALNPDVTDVQDFYRLRPTLQVNLMPSLMAPNLDRTPVINFIDISLSFRRAVFIHCPPFLSSAVRNRYALLSSVTETLSPQDNFAKQL